MTFDGLLVEIEKLIGLDLDSIATAEGFKILKVDRAYKKIDLITENGREMSRSFEEMKRVWNKLCKDPAVHVDSVLSGSSSSRNQPETIFANLPFIEWLKYNNKKHISLRKDATHDYGTLKKMDAFNAEEIKEKLRNSAEIIAEVVVVSDDLRTVSEIFESISGLKLDPVEAGVYQKVKDGIGYLIVSIGQVTGSIEPGTYPVIKGITRPHSGRPIGIADREFTLVRGGGFNTLISLE